MPQTAGEVLRDARRRKKVTQQELADLAGTTQTSIARWEGEARSPTVRQLATLLDALGYDLELRAKPATQREGQTRGFSKLLDGGQAMQRGRRSKKSR